MKPRKKAARVAAEVAREPRTGSRWWIWPAGFSGAFLVLLVLYGPSLRGPFLFDDNYLPFDLPGQTARLGGWLGVRPLLMLTYWLNFRLSGAEDSYGYHLLNLMLHTVNGMLMFVVVRRLLAQVESRAGVCGWLAGFAAAVFLLHPLQTEAVAYVAGRSELLSVMFLLSALAVFLYRPPGGVGWRTTAGILLLFGAALLSKEHALALVPLLLVTDYWWNPGFSFAGIRRNWKLYASVAFLAALGVAFFWDLITRAGSAGFALKDFTWYQYFFTQCRAFFFYLRMFVAPVGQALDYDVAISRTIFEHGAVFGLAAILALVGAAWHFRRRFPLAVYGLFVYIVLMAPTSSFLPIRDPIADRRMYLPMIGLLLIVVDMLRRVEIPRPPVIGALAAVLLAAAVLTYNRSMAWGDAISLWESNARVTPKRWRVRFQLAHAYYSAGRCAEAVREYEAASRLNGPSDDFLLNWGLSYDCAGQPDKAIEKLYQAARLAPGAHVYSQIGMVYAKQSRWAEALDALALAEKMDANHTVIYIYRGGVKLSTGDPAGAVAEYRRALALEPGNEFALAGLRQAEQRLPGATSR